MQSFFFVFATVASLQFLVLIVPGPDFALVTRNALLYPRRESIYTALGIALGLCIHILYCVFGLGLVLTHALMLFDILKYLGAAYLIYIGVRSWQSSLVLCDKVGQDAASRVSIITRGQALRQGFLCNVLNPKAGLFFLGLFTVVIKPGTPWWQQTTYGVWMVVITFAWFSWLACLITRPTVRYKLQRLQPITLKILGVLLVVMGLGLLFTYSVHHALN